MQRGTQIPQETCSNSRKNPPLGATSRKQQPSSSESEEAKVGIFKVRESPGKLAPTSKQEILANLGVSTDSTEPETISVDLPTITVSEDDLHDTFSDLDTESDADLEDLEKIGREMAAAPSPIESEPTESPVTISAGKPPAGPSTSWKRIGSNPSLATSSHSRSHSIREKVKEFGGKVKDVSGKVKGIIVSNLRRSHEDVSTRSSTPSASTMVSAGDESSKKLELKKKELELKKKEKEIKELESTKKKEDEKAKKLRKEEEDKLAKWEQEIKKKEKETNDRLKAKEELLAKKEKEIATREANLAKKQAEFDAMCKQIQAKIDAERQSLMNNKDGISLRASSPNYETVPSRVCGSVSQLNIDEPNKPPRSTLTTKAGSPTSSSSPAASKDDPRRRLPAPPRPPLPPVSSSPVAASASASATTSSSSTTKTEPIYARVLPKPPKTDQTSITKLTTSQVSSNVSHSISSQSTTMKTAPTAPQSSTLFRISPASSNESTLYCSDFVDIPLDDDATLRGSVQNGTFDPKTFYRMIVARWKASHPRRILKQTPPPRTPRSRTCSPIVGIFGHRSDHHRIHDGDSFGGSILNVAAHRVKTNANVHSTKQGVTYYSSPPSRQPIYQVVSNYRLQRRKEFYSPMEENVYDELIFPIGPSGGLTAGGPAISFYHQPLPPPRTKRNKICNLRSGGRNFHRLNQSANNSSAIASAIDTDCSTGGGYSLPTTTTGSSSSLNALMASEDESRETITH